MYEANLMKVGLELETEDKSVRAYIDFYFRSFFYLIFISLSVACIILDICVLGLFKACFSVLRTGNHTHFTVTLNLMSPLSGVRGRKDLFCEDPCSMGSVGHLRRCIKDQGPI